MADPVSPYRPYHLWIAGATVVFAVGMTLFGCLELWRAWQLVHHGGRGQATVVDYKVFPPTGNTGTMYMPVLRFVDPSGKTWQKDDAQSTNKRSYEIGQTVEVIYMPARPGDFKTNTWDSVWEVGVIALVLGVISDVMFFGLFAFVLAALKRPEIGAKWAWVDRYLVPLRIFTWLAGR